MGKSDQSKEKEVTRGFNDVAPCIPHDDDVDEDEDDAEDEDDEADGCENNGKEDEGDDDPNRRLLASLPNSKEPESCIPDCDSMV
jgi:hypothetical protein